MMHAVHRRHLRNDLVRLQDVSRVLVWGSGLWALGFFWMFRGWLFGSFDGVFGDEGDARLLVTLLEHWYRVYAGLTTDWLNPPFFYPEKHVLGFTDAYFLYGVAYSTLRAMNVEPFLAFMLVMAALSAVGYVGFMRLAIVDLGATPMSAAVGAFLFVFANMMAVKMGHAQSYCAMLLPLIAHLAAAAFKSASAGRAVWLAGTAGLLHALIFSTAYLTGWFATTSALLVGLIFLALCGSARDFLGLAWTTKRHVAVAYLGAFALGMVPFLIIYLPVWQNGNFRTMDDVASYAPRLRDIINVGTDNLIWGEVLRWLGIAGLPNRPSVEIEMGYTPLVFGICVLMTIAMARLWLRASDRSDRSVSLLLALGIALFAYWLVQINYFGFRPWVVIWASVPGASAIRATFRAQIVLNLAAALLVTAALDKLLVAAPFHRALTAGLVAALLMAEQINRTHPPVFSRGEQVAWLSRVPAPPQHCRAFYVVPHPTPTAWYVHQIDAVMVAVTFGLPTVNGYSSNFPKNWQFYDPASQDYARLLHDWLSRNELKKAGICGLDPRAGLWTEGRD